MEKFVITATVSQFELCLLIEQTHDDELSLATMPSRSWVVHVLRSDDPH